MIYFQLHRMYSSYNLLNRVQAGLGVGRVTTNRAENENKWLQEDLNTFVNSGLHVVIGKLEKRYLGNISIIFYY